jgi:hypothetical protein
MPASCLNVWFSISAANHCAHDQARLVTDATWCRRDPPTGSRIDEDGKITERWAFSDDTQAINEFFGQFA